MAGLLDSMQATPRQNGVMGWIADALGAANDYAQKPDPTMPMGKANPVLSLLSDFVGLPATARTADRISYGEPLTTGKGWATQVRPDTLEAAMSVAPVVAKYPKQAAGAALGLLGMADTGAAKAMFIGANAKTWDAAKAAKAAQMEQAGKDARSIWSETGTFKGADGTWRQEIDDSGAFLKGGDTFGETIMGAYKRGAARTGDQAYKTTVGDVMWHPGLADAYPSVPGIETQMMPGIRSASGSLANHGGRDVLHVAEQLPSAQSKSVTLHELQHYIQDREGWASGGSPSEFLSQGQSKESAINEWPFMNAAVEKLRQSAASGKSAVIKTADGMEMIPREDVKRRLSEFEAMFASTPSEQYRRLAGEAEARATQARMNMSPAERLAKFPFDSYDVPIDQLIVR